MPNEKTEVTFTEEQQKFIEEHYVSKTDFEKLATEHAELIKGFNALMAEYNALHVRTLVPNLVKDRAE